jgi:hypothetical protein
MRQKNCRQNSETEKGMWYQEEQNTEIIEEKEQNLVRVYMYIEHCLESNLPVPADVKIVKFTCGFLPINFYPVHPSERRSFFQIF